MLVVTETPFQFGRFGRVRLFHSATPSPPVILLVSDRNGWNPTGTAVAHNLASHGAIVVGVDLQHYTHILRTSREWCSYPGGDFDALSKFVQKKLTLQEYELPILIGYGAGAALVYSVLAQAPPNLFRGALSVGFCPALQIHPPLCQWHDLQWQETPQRHVCTLRPAVTLQAPWVVIDGATNGPCDAQVVQAFVEHVQSAEVLHLREGVLTLTRPETWLPEVQHGLSRIWRRTESVEAATTKTVMDLPLIEMPVEHQTESPFAVIFSGDGGWASIDRDVGITLTSHGIAVVGVNSLKYFWTVRTPEGSAQDLERILHYYFTTWNKTKAILIGYSLGADVLPFLVNHLSPEMIARVDLIALLAPAQTAQFEFHLTDWVGAITSKEGKPVRPEVEKLKGKRLLCFYGEEESDSLCPHLDANLAKVIRLKGGHHFDGGYQQLAETILREANVTTQGRVED